MTKISRGILFLILSFTFAPLFFGSSGCGGAAFTIGGTVSGLPGTLVLQNNGRDDLTVTGDGSFTFSNAVDDGQGYEVTIKTQPLGGTCTVSQGSGVVLGADVTNVVVSCVRKIVFASSRNPNLSDTANTNNTYNIWLMNEDGSELKALTTATAAGADSYSPQWSPDGTKIFFESTRNPNLSDTANTNNISNIWLVNADGSGLKALTTATVVDAESYHPQWSPDGTKIVFVSYRKLDSTDAVNDNNTYNIWLVNADGNGLKALTTATALNANSDYPQWSPDGTRIVFTSSLKTDSSNTANNAYNIWLVNADGDGLRALTTATAAGASSGTSPSQWSPDGTKIVFRSTRNPDLSNTANTNNTSNIWLVNADGNGLKALTTATATGTGIGSSPFQWSPDGMKIVFVSSLKTDSSDAANDNKTRNIWLVNADGDGLRALTTATAAGASSGSPQWSPNGAKIVFTSSRKTDSSNAANDNNTSNIWLMNADGSGLKALTTATAAGADSDSPQWFP